MRGRALLAAAVVLAVLSAGCLGQPENLPPSVSAHASPTSAAVGQEVVFTGTAFDPDGSIVRFVWDFNGDGSADFENATRGTAAYAYPAPGNFTALFTAFDDRGARATANVTVSVTARFVVNTDWGADHAYRISGPVGLNAASLGVKARPPGSVTPLEFRVGAGLEVVSASVYRIVLPPNTLDRYASTAVEVEYNGSFASNRTVRPVPFWGSEKDPLTRYHGVIREVRPIAGGDTTLAYDGVMDLSVVGAIVLARFEGTGTSLVTSDADGTNTTTNITFNRVAWNQSFGRYTPSLLRVDYEWSGTGTVLAVGPTGFATALNLSAFEGARRFGNLTFERAQGNGTYLGDLVNSAGTAAYTLGGNQTLATSNGNGQTVSVLKLFENLTLNGTYGGALYQQTNLTVRLMAASDAFEHPDVEIAWNVTGRLGATNLTDAGRRFLDDNRDGSYNPDPRQRYVSDGQNFGGLAPDELLEGDAFSLTNSGGASVRLLVGPATTEVLAVSGFAPVAIQAVTVNGTVEAPTAPWELPGSLSYRVVAAGAHAGLRLESHERLSYNAQSFAKDLMLVAKGT